MIDEADHTTKNKKKRKRRGKKGVRAGLVERREAPAALAHRVAHAVDVELAGAPRHHGPHGLPDHEQALDFVDPTQRLNWSRPL